MDKLIQAIEAATVSLRQEAQNHIALADQRDALVKSNEYMEGEIAQLEQRAKNAEKERSIAETKYAELQFRNGELSAMLKELLRQNVDIAAKATEMLKNLEDKPAPMLAADEPIKVDEEERRLEKHISKDLFDISKVPEGREFTLDAPYGENVTNRMLKRWYNRIIGKCPQNFRDAPSIELRKESGGGWTYLRQAPKLTNSVGVPAKEDRDPLPFRPEGAEPEGNGEPSKAFANNGEAIPEVPRFLMQGPRYDADQGREPSSS